MPLKFHCSNGHGLTVSEQHAGKTVRCPKCKEQLHAPPAEAAKAFTLVKSEQTGVNLAEFSVAAESSVARETRRAQQGETRDETTPHAHQETTSQPRKRRRRRSGGYLPGANGGIGRLSFFLGYLVLSLCTVLPLDPVIISVGGMLGFLALTYLRLTNVGMHPAWLLALFVPVLNLFVIYRIVIAPEGYTDHKRLDSFSVLAFVSTLLFVAAFAALLWFT